MLFDYVEKYKEVQGAMVDSLAHLTEITRDEKVRFVIYISYVAANHYYCCIRMA